jgi:hypothetical protein
MKRGFKVSKQSNEIYEAADLKDPTTRNLTRRDRKTPNRDEFVKAKEHADDVLGLDEKVSDGMRRALARFPNSPLTLYMEVINDPEQPWERRLDAAERAKPYLHRKLEDKHGTPHHGSGGNSPPGAAGPTINLSVNRPRAAVVIQQTSSQKHDTAQAEATKPKVFKKKVAKKTTKK